MNITNVHDFSTFFGDLIGTFPGLEITILKFQDFSRFMIVRILHSAYLYSSNQICKWFKWLKGHKSLSPSKKQQQLNMQSWVTMLFKMAPAHQEYNQSISYLRKVHFFPSFVILASSSPLPLSSLSSPDLPPHRQLYHRCCICNLEQRRGGGRVHGVGDWRHRTPTQLQQHDRRLSSRHAGVRHRVQRHHHAIQRRMCGQRQPHTAYPHG